MHSVDGIEVRINGDEFAADALDVGGDGGVIDDDLRIAHQLLAAFHMARKSCQCVHHPELGHGQRHVLPVPGDAHAFGLDAQWPELMYGIGLRRLAQGIHAPEQGADARRQLMQGDVLGEVIIGTEAQARDHIEVRVARGEENDGQASGLGAQVAAQVEAALGLVTEADIEEVAKIKMPDLNANDIDAAMKIIAGTARQMGIETPADI